MGEEDWSPEGVKRLMRSMDSSLRKDPLEVEREAAARRQEQAKAERIAAALPGRLREQEQFLKRNVPDDLIDGRLARRREAQGITEGPESRLPAQVDKDRVEERLRFAKDQLADRSGSELVRRDVDTLALRAEWQRHVDGLNLSFRERVRYEAEAEGRQLTGSELSHEEAVRNAHNMWSEGVRGPSYTEIDRHVALAKENGTWPPPELHTGPGSKPRPHPQIYTYEQFKRYCANPAHPYIANAGHIGSSSVVERAEKPVAPIRPLPSRQPPQFRMENLASSGAAPRTMQRDVNEGDPFVVYRGRPVPFQRLQSRQPPQFRMETPALAGAELQAAHREANGHESRARPVPGRQGLRRRLMNILKPISQRVVDRISRIGSGNKEYAASPPPEASVHARSIGRRVDVISSPDHQTTSIRHPAAYQADETRVATRNISPTGRARESGAAERASLIAGRAAEPRSVYSR